MTHCSLLFDALDKRLDKKMSIEEIAKELCADVDDPRGKVLRIIKVHKGKKWLIENADWLGYNVNFIRNVEGPVMYERSSEIMGKELPKIGDGSYTIGKLSMMLRENKDKVDDEKEGITIMGNLDEGMMHHLCLIDPYPGKEFRKVTCT